MRKWLFALLAKAGPGWTQANTTQRTQANIDKTENQRHNFEATESQRQSFKTTENQKQSFEAIERQGTFDSSARSLQHTSPASVHGSGAQPRQVCTCTVMRIGLSDTDAVSGLRAVGAPHWERGRSVYQAVAFKHEQMHNLGYSVGPGEWEATAD